MPGTTGQSHADDDEEHDHVTVTTPRSAGFGVITVARGSLVVVPDQERLVRPAEPTADGRLVPDTGSCGRSAHAQGILEP